MPKANKQEDKKPEEEKKKEGEGMYEERLAAVEVKVDQILESVSGNANMSKMEEEDKKPEEEKTKQEEDKKPEEEKTKQEEDKDPKEEEKKKEGEGEPKPGEAEDKLPKAPAGETDETASPEGDKVNMLEKKIGELTKKLEGLMKTGEIIKSTTPRTGHEISKRREEKKQDVAMDIMKKVKAGEMSLADVNRTIKGMVRKNDDEAMKAFFDGIHSDKGVA